MNKNIRNVSALGLFALSATAILVGCNKNNNLNQPHITMYGDKFLDVSYGNLEFGKDAVITIKPKEGKYVHLRKPVYNETSVEYTGDALKPYVGYGNAIYQSKGPLTEGFHFDYLPLSDKAGKEGFETFKLTIKGEYFTSPIVISYRDTERYYTAQGKEESNKGRVFNISDLYEQSPYLHFNTGEEGGISYSKNNPESFEYYSNYSKFDICEDYQRFAFKYNNEFVTLTNDTTCTVYGTKKEESNKNEPIEIATTTSIYTDSEYGDQYIMVKINNDKLLENGNENIYENLEFEFNIAAKDNETVKIKGTADTTLTNSFSPKVYQSFSSTPIFEKDADTEKELLVSAGIGNDIAEFAWVEPLENSCFRVVAPNGPQPLANFDITFTDEEASYLFQLNRTYESLDNYDELKNYFKGVLKYVDQNNQEYIRVFVPYDYTDEIPEDVKNDNKALVVITNATQSEEIAQKLESVSLKALKLTFGRPLDYSFYESGVPTYVGITNVKETKTIKGTNGGDSTLNNKAIMSFDDGISDTTISITQAENAEPKDYAVKFDAIVQNDETEKYTIVKNVFKNYTSDSSKTDCMQAIYDDYINSHEELKKLKFAAVCSDIVICPKITTK